MQGRPSIRLAGGLSAWLLAAACTGAGEGGMRNAGGARGGEMQGAGGTPPAVSSDGGAAGDAAERAGSGPTATAGAIGSAGYGGASEPESGTGGSGAADGHGRGGSGNSHASGRAGASAAGDGGEDPGSAAEGEAGSAGGNVPDDGFDVAIVRASDVKPSAPGTVGIVTFSVPVPAVVEAHIELGLDTTYGMTAPVDLEAPNHRTLLLGLKPSRLYHVRIVVSDGTLTHRSADHTLFTGLPTRLVPPVSVDVIDEARRERGFILLSYRDPPAGNVPFIVDADGEVVWWYESDMLGIAHAVLSATGRNLWLVGPGGVGSPLRRVSLDTLEEQSYPDTFASHDITAVTGETMAYLDYGEADCDSVFEIEPSGVTREVFESEGWVSPGLCHANAVRYAAKQDTYTFSDRYEDVLVLSRAGDLLWRLSERVPAGHAAWGGAQHGHQLLDDSLLIFANAGMSSAASAAIEFDLSGNELRRFQTGHFSLHLGDVQRLPHGNTIVNFSNESFIQEFDPEGAVVLELQGEGNHFGYSSWRQSLYGDALPAGLR